jgi:hypothetical protein
MASPDSRSSPAPTGNYYGGIVFFKNTSTYNQYWEIELTENLQGGFFLKQIALEKGDVIKHHYIFFVLFADDDVFDKSSVNPNNYFKTIHIYDMDNGTLLKTFNSGDVIFNFISESTVPTEHGDWEININNFN